MIEETKRVFRELDKKEVGEVEFKVGGMKNVKRKKKEVRKELRKWRKGKSSREEYNKKKKSTISCVRKKRKRIIEGLKRRRRRPVQR